MEFKRNNGRKIKSISWFIVQPDGSHEIHSRNSVVDKDLILRYEDMGDHSETWVAIVRSITGEEVERYNIKNIDYIEWAK